MFPCQKVNCSVLLSVCHMNLNMRKVVLKNDTVLTIVAFFCYDYITLHCAVCITARLTFETLLYRCTLEMTGFVSNLFILTDAGIALFNYFRGQFFHRDSNMENTASYLKIR